jgi:hypothetical protein
MRDRTEDEGCLGGRTVHCTALYSAQYLNCREYEYSMRICLLYNEEAAQGGCFSTTHRAAQ